MMEFQTILSFAQVSVNPLKEVDEPCDQNGACLISVLFLVMS